MARFGLGWNAQAIAAVPGQPGDWVETRVGHPNAVVLMNSRLDNFLEPGLVVLGSIGVESGINLKSEVGQERRLTSHKIVASVSVQNLAIMLWKRVASDLSPSQSHVDLLISKQK